MFRNILIGVLSAVLVVALGTAAYNVIGAQAQGGTFTFGEKSANVATQPDVHDYITQLAALPMENLNDEEKTDLLYMYEEEKMARDVYNVLYATWNLQVFQNIAASEQRHMDAVKFLLDRYNLTAPSLSAGSFADSSLQTLYHSLLEQGRRSLADALKVGAAIEEVDILDLQKRIARTDNTDIQTVYTNLMNGSKNHLQAFTSTLKTQTGETYVPQYLSPEQYTEALTYLPGNRIYGNTGQGQGRGPEQGRGQAQQNRFQQTNQWTTGTPQNQPPSLMNLTTLQGRVISYAYGTLTIQTNDGQQVAIQLGNQRYVAMLNFNPQPGQNVTVTGFMGQQGMFVASQVVMEDGTTYIFRQDAGRPNWSGGRGGNR